MESSICSLSSFDKSKSTALIFFFSIALRFKIVLFPLLSGLCQAISLFGMLGLIWIESFYGAIFKSRIKIILPKMLWINKST